MTTIIGMVAMDHLRGIGWRGAMPWGDRPVDPDHFRAMTLGCPLIVGRKTLPSVLKLERRHLVCVSASNTLPSEHQLQHVTHCHDELEAVGRAVQICSHMNTKRICVIGGFQTYKSLWPLITEFFVTVVASEFRSDVRFPEFEKGWAKQSQSSVRGKNAIPFYHQRWLRI